ncbi:hypothetical protein QCA50_012626 [Cerrena zonata]|uniref:Uncharacterized protein n=1 Tax=Cerrena zonata TaxID=2478898 RepID=A0AAW0FYA5_9APHY
MTGSDSDEYEPSQMRGEMEEEYFRALPSPRPGRMAAQETSSRNSMLFNGGACDSQLTDSQFVTTLDGGPNSVHRQAEYSLDRMTERLTRKEQIVMIAMSDETVQSELRGCREENQRLKKLLMRTMQDSLKQSDRIMLLEEALRVYNDHFEQIIPASKKDEESNITESALFKSNAVLPTEKMTLLIRSQSSLTKDHGLK